MLGEPNTVAIAFFLGFIGLALAITVWAARRTRSTEHFFAAGRSVTAPQNGLALAGDFMVKANCLIDVPTDVERLNPGDLVFVQLLDGEAWANQSEASQTGPHRLSCC